MIWIYPSSWGKAFPSFIDYQRKSKSPTPSNSWSSQPTHPLNIEKSTLELKARLQMLLCKSIYLTTIYRQLTPSILFPMGNHHQRSPKMTQDEVRIMTIHGFSRQKKGRCFFLQMSLLKKKEDKRKMFIFGCVNCKNKSTK